MIKKKEISRRIDMVNMYGSVRMPVDGPKPKKTYTSTKKKK